MKRFPWILTAFAVPAFALLIALGVWQLQRLEWKENLIAQGDRAAKLPPVVLLHPSQIATRREPTPTGLPRTATLPPAPAVPDEPVPQLFPEFQRVVINCDWNEHGVDGLQTIQNGQPGVRIVTTCQGYLVDLGFIAEGIDWHRSPPIYVVQPELVPRPLLTQARTVPQPSLFTPAPMVEWPPGCKRPRSHCVWRFFAGDYRGIAALRLSEQERTEQVLFAQESAFPNMPELIAEAPPAAFSNNHLGYAITWFGLAIVLLAFYVAMLRRRPLKPSRSASEATGKKEASS